MKEISWESVHNNYFTRFSEDDFFKDFDIKLEKKEYQELLSNFEYNVKAVVSILSLPLVMSSNRSKLLIYDKLLTKELILTAPLATDDPETEDAKKKRINTAYEKVQKLFFQELESREGAKNLWDITYSFLNELHNKKEVSIAITELINQSCILIWSSFEVLARDTFKCFINDNPSRIDDIRDFLKAKKIYNNIISLDTLVKHSYNLTNNMGTILEESIDFSKLSNIREIFKTLFPQKSELIKYINDSLLWKMNKQRHLLVHKKGIVDKNYSETTDDKTPIGNKIDLNPELIKQYLEITKNCGLEIIKSAL